MEKGLLLIVLSGFEEERAEQIIESFEPNQLILGKPSVHNSINNELNKISEKKFGYLKNKYQSLLIDEFEFSCTDIVTTRTLIEQLINKHQFNSNIVIAPLNNKISTLGVTFACLKNDNIQICYASANQYNINSYSEASDYFIVFNFNQVLNDSLNLLV